MKNFYRNSMVLGVLYFPMWLLSKLPYKEAWEHESVRAKIGIGVLAFVLLSFMHLMLENYKAWVAEDDKEEDDKEMEKGL